MIARIPRGFPRLAPFQIRVGVHRELGSHLWSYERIKNSYERWVQQWQMMIYEYGLESHVRVIGWLPDSNK